MKVMMYDATAGALSTIWAAGRHLAKWDAVLPVRSWSEAMRSLSAIDPPTHLQVWGHGKSGRPLMDDQRNPDIHAELRDACRFAPGAEVWWRSCDVFSRDRGARFAADAVEITGAAHVGHTRIVSAPWPMLQSGGFGLHPGQEVYWDPYEGTKKDGSSRGSQPFAPHTILVTQMRIPRRWWLTS